MIEYGPKLVLTHDSSRPLPTLNLVITWVLKLFEEDFGFWSDRTNIFKEKGTTHSLPINENKLIENLFANHWVG